MSRREDGDFLGRWSARKLKAREAREGRPEPEQAADRPPDQPPADPAADAPAKSEEEILRELGLPDPDGLVKGDDFKAFLKSGVPAGIRRRALRRLWLSDPVLANLDGLNDYDQDFTDAATVVKELKTAYSVGRGFLRDKPTETAAAEPPTPPADGAETAAGDAESAAVTEPLADEPAGVERSADREVAGPPAGADDRAEQPVDPAREQAAGAPEPDMSAPRLARMRFRFDAG